MLARRQPGEGDSDAALRASTTRLLSDPEPRVRLAAGDVLGGLAARDAGATWAVAGPAVLAVVARDWARDADAPPRDGGPVATAAGADLPADGLVGDVLASAYTRAVPGAGELRHGSEGWRCLETAFRALLSVMDGAGAAFAPHATPELRGTVLAALLHPNRYVREAAYSALGGLAGLAGASGGLASWADDAATALADGLSENWSQVRLAACVAARALLAAAAPDPDLHARALAALLPPLAFNRRDAAEGVAAYSAATWAAATKGAGAAAVARAIHPVAAYYARCARTNNHTVREAAAACFGELAAKVDPERVAPKAAGAVAILRALARDDAWPVRDAAAAALAEFAVAHPTAVESHLDDVLSLWGDALGDNVPSVRGGAAAALARAAASPLAARVLPAVEALLKERLPRAGDQPAGGGMPAARGGPAPQAPTRAPTAATPSTLPDDDLFHPGALLRPRRDAGGIDYSCGCMDYGYKREREPWEDADGAVRLLGALASVAPSLVESYMPALADAVARRHYAAHTGLRTAAWETVPLVLAGLGVRAFKRHLDPLLEPLFDSLTGDHALCRAAAGAAVGALRDAVGPRVLAGRLAAGDPAWVRVLETSPDVPPPAGAFVGGRGAPGGATPHYVPGAAHGSPPSMTLPSLGAASRPEGYAPGGFPMRVPAPATAREAGGGSG